MAEVVPVWAKVYAVEVNAEVGWVDGVFMGTLVLLTEQHSAVKPVMFPCRHSEEVRSTGYI